MVNQDHFATYQHHFSPIESRQLPINNRLHSLQLPMRFMLAFGMHTKGDLEPVCPSFEMFSDDDSTPGSEEAIARYESRVARKPASRRVASELDA